MASDRVLHEINVSDDNENGLGATFRVLADGRLQVETEELGCTLTLADSHRLASTMMAAMEGRTDDPA